MSEVVQRTVSDGVAVITLNRPARLNAWTVEMEHAYFSELDWCAESAEVRAIVLTGAGRGFCAGADMQDLQALGENGADGAAARAQERRPQSYPLTVPKPIIAAINGPCAGIGLVQALMDVDSWFQRFREAHYHLVKRVIGSEVRSLKGIPASRLEHTSKEPLFPDLWQVINEVTGSW